jgi:sugar phosphate isomerase/epimerase
MGRLAISELTTFRWTFEEDVEHYRAAGIGAIGVWRQKLADCGEERGARLLAEAGMFPSSLQWAGGFTGSEDRSHDESLVDARQAIATAARLGCRTLLLHSGARGIHTHNHARRLFRQALDRLLPLGEERGVTLAIEPMRGACGSDFTFLQCLDETLDLVASYDSPALGIALDTWHWGHEAGLFQRLPQIVPRLALVQLGDSRLPPGKEPDRCPLGDGSVPLERIVRELTAAGYDGFYEVELMGEEIETGDYGEIIARSARAFDGWLAATPRAEAQ